MGFKFMHNAGGQTPMTRHMPATAAATLKDAAVMLTAGKLVLLGTVAGSSCIGVAQSSPVAADELVEVVIASPDAVFRVGKSGAATPAIGGKYEGSADGMTINADGTTNSKWKVIGTSDGEYLVMNISFGL